MGFYYYKKYFEKAKKITFPVEEREIFKTLKDKDPVLISGWLLCARDTTHKKLISALKEGSFSFDFKNQAIYYVGPTPAPPGKIIGSAGPTTSVRMDPYVEFFLNLGIAATIGKGKRSPEVMKLFEKYNALYLVTFGGAGAFLSQFIFKLEILAFPELGPEAFFRIKVRDFPALVVK